MPSFVLGVFEPAAAAEIACKSRHFLNDLSPVVDHAKPDELVDRHVVRMLHRNLLDTIRLGGRN